VRRITKQRCAERSLWSKLSRHLVNPIRVLQANVVVRCREEHFKKGCGAPTPTQSICACWRHWMVLFGAFEHGLSRSRYALNHLNAHMNEAPMNSIAVGGPSIQKNDSGDCAAVKITHWASSRQVGGVARSRSTYLANGFRSSSLGRDPVSRTIGCPHQSGRGLKATRAKEPIAQQSDITSHSRKSPRPICIAMASIFLDSRQVRTTATDVTSRTISFARFYSRHLHRFINVPDDESRTRPRV
jgi:hypothetical protein